MGDNFFGLFGQSVAGIDCLGNGRCARGYNLCGTCYRILGRGYRGHLWAYDGGDFSVTRFNVAFTEDCAVSASLPGCILIADFTYGKLENAERRILCYCGSERAERQGVVAFAKGSDVTGTEITLTERFRQKCASGGRCRRCFCKAFADADKLQKHSELTRVFDQINACEFPISATQIYFESKALEVLAVLSADCYPKESVSLSSNTDDGFTQRMKRYIDENCGLNLTIETLAKIAYMSPGKLKYSFKRSFDRSIFEYLTEIRMEKAKLLLTDPRLTIEGIAAEVGYKKSGAFAAAFRKYAGILPKEYRSAERAKL